VTRETAYIRGTNVYKNIRRESNLVPDFRFVDDGVARSSGVAVSEFPRQPQVSNEGLIRLGQVAAPLKIRS